MPFHIVFNPKSGQFLTNFNDFQPSKQVAYLKRKYKFDKITFCDKYSESVFIDVD